MGLNAAVAMAPVEYEVPNVEDLKLDTQKSVEIQDTEKTEIVTAVNENINSIMQVNLNSLVDRREIVYMVENLGTDTVFKSAEKSKMLNISMSELSKLGSEGGTIVSELTRLQEQMNELNPENVDFDKKGLFGGIPASVKKYFKKYEQADDIIDEIVASLQKGKRQLKSDNTTLEIEQQMLRELSKKLSSQIDYCMELDKQIQARVDAMKSVNGDKDKIDFFENEILYTLRQKTYDFNQMLVVNQQGIVAMEILRRNNKELIRAVERAQTVTVSALRIAVAVASGLYHQKLVLEKVQKLNASTNKISTATSNLVRNQGADLQRQSANAQADIDALKDAFRDTFNALDEISQYKGKALPQLQEQIQEFQQLAIQGEERIAQLDASNN